MQTKAHFICLSVFTCFIGLQFRSTATAQTRYPSTFLWGTAMSAHQVEGLASGGENADWYPFEHTPEHTYNNDTADVATDHWRRYQEDFQLGASMGLNTIRTSVAWEKIEPAEGQFREDVIEHYRAVFTYMRQLGLRPMITLLHGTVPLWFQNHGGWLASDSPQQFSTYVGYVVTRLGDLCDLWVTINEPMVLIGEGYLLGAAPPQIASPGSGILAGWNMARAHRMATARIHELQPLPAPNTIGECGGDSGRCRSRIARRDCSCQRALRSSGDPEGQRVPGRERPRS